MRATLLILTLLATTSLGLAGGSVSFMTLDESPEALTGVVKEIQKDGVLLEMEKATSVIAWKRIHPADRYRLRASILSEEDADAHLRLAEQSLAEAYYSGARKALEKALILGHEDGRKIQDLLDTIDYRECEGLHAQFQEAISRQEYGKAKEIARKMAMRFASNPLTAEVRRKVPALVRAEAKAQAQAVKDAANAAAEAKEAKRKAWLDARFGEVKKAVANAKKAMVSARHYDAKTSLTKARKGYEAAERYFLRARSVLLRIRRATRSGPEYDRADREIRSVERRLLEAYVSLGRMYVSQGNYRRGVIYVDRALLFDPVNPEALRLAERIRREWIRRSMRRLTNSPGVISK